MAQFDSHDYAKFGKEYGLKPIKFSPYHSQGNGKVESAVKIAKDISKKSRYEDPHLALLDCGTRFQHYQVNCSHTQFPRQHIEI